MGEVIGIDPFARLPERYRHRATQIAERVRDIDALLRPCEPAKIGEAVLRMFRQFKPQPGTEPGDMASEYRLACADLPEWALSEAAGDFLGGRVENHTGRYMPVCAEFAKHARSILAPFFAERQSLRIEAEKLVERAGDEARRARIEIERSNPAVKARVSAMVADAVKGTPKPQARLHGETPTADKFAEFRKPREFVSKLSETKIGRV